MGEVSGLDQFEDQFLADNPEGLGINFEEEAKFFDPEAAHDADFLQPTPPSIRTTRYACIYAKWAPYRFSREKAKSTWRGAWNAVSSACKRRSAAPRWCSAWL
jgi:hypothetical protein